MKKISTVTRKQTNNFPERKLTIGLDLGDRSSCYCVLDEADEVIQEAKLSATPNAMNKVFAEVPRSRIALETGTHSPWVSRLLSALGHEVIVAHARNVRLIGESRRKDDRMDARTLARLARIDPQLLAPVKDRSAEAQAHLSVIRGRASLVRARTALINTVRELTKSSGQRLPGCNPRNVADKAQTLSPELQLAPGPLLKALQSLSEQIVAYTSASRASQKEMNSSTVAGERQLPPRATTSHSREEVAVADDLKNRGAQHQSRINIHEDPEVRYWTKALGVSED